MCLEVGTISDNRLVKCPHCEERLPKGESIRHTNKRYYHKECYEEATASSRHYKELIETVCNIWGIKAPTRKMTMQIKRYKDELDLTYKGMELTLDYFYNLLGNNPREGDGVGIIPWEYDNAKENYIKGLRVQDSLDDFNVEIEPKKVTVKKKSNTNRKRTVIDIEGL